MPEGALQHDQGSLGLLSDLSNWCHTLASHLDEMGFKKLEILEGKTIAKGCSTILDVHYTWKRKFRILFSLSWF